MDRSPTSSARPLCRGDRHITYLIPVNSLSQPSNNSVCNGGSFCQQMASIEVSLSMTPRRRKSSLLGRCAPLPPQAPALPHLPPQHPDPVDPLRAHLKEKEHMIQRLVDKCIEIIFNLLKFNEIQKSLISSKDHYLRVIFLKINLSPNRTVI